MVLKGKIQIGKKLVEVGEYIGDTLRLANDYSTTSIRLTKLVKTLDDSYVFNPAGFLAAHSAELYLKALIVGYEGQNGYYKFRKLKPSHDLIKLLGVLLNSAPEASSLENILLDLNKYSGDKVRFAEKQCTNQEIIDYGNAEILNIRLIKKFVEKKFE